MREAWRVKRGAWHVILSEAKDLLFTLCPPPSTLYPLV
jgi:hypothetical protein